MSVGSCDRNLSIRANLDELRDPILLCCGHNLANYVPDLLSISMFEVGSEWV